MEGEGITSGSLSPPDAEISSVGSPEITCTQEASPPFTEIQSSSETVAPTEDLRDKIIRQVEYYFSDENLPTDNFLMKYVKKNKDGFVPVAVIASFRKIRKLGQDNSLIVAALKESSHLVVSPDGKKVRRIHPLALTEVKDPKSRTVLVENLPEDHSTENIQKIFGNAGKVKNICIRDPHAIEESSKSSKAEKLFSGKMHALVEYETVEEAEKAVATLNDEENWRSGMRVGLLLKRMGKYGITKRGSKESTASEKNNNVPASDATGDDQKLKSNEHHDETREEVEGERPLNERNGWRGRSRGRSRGQKQHYIIGQGDSAIALWKTCFMVNQFGHKSLLLTIEV